ncbi:MAG TPA: diaminopimelate epimerase [Desulfarculaceae bacterium]|nr:diaminopimelate epimerase [Desulfarculaceae bacterium]
MSFWKMQGSGNDFIIIDNRKPIFPEENRAALVAKLCRRATGIGADGLILIEDDPYADFLWRFYNADGSEAEMCGNGGRCAARFAFLKRITSSDMVFTTLAGPIRARVDGDQVRLEMSRPCDRQRLELDCDGALEKVDFINTGVPHAVIMVEDDLDLVDVNERGAKIRYHQAFAPAGSNANFIKVEDESTLSIRTYERGVESETLACGTGAVAAALIAHAKGLVVSPTKVITRSGESLTIYYKKEGETFVEVFLEGVALIVYRGVIDRDFLE